MPPMIVAVGMVMQRIEGCSDLEAVDPVTLLHEYVTALGALLRGDTVTTAGRYVSLDGVRLDWPPVVAPALLVGAGGLRSLRLSGQIASGTILTGGTSPDGVRQARRHFDEGRRAAGRP